ncbi:MAG: formylglycine-generating enzyme family protein [Bacteroidales bacterium]|nr:formylglycine-generating enzyme family protein [Bacteroidales bacterium]MBN2758512.1 formylglycine-generating enzyme family protein [Bacteroidales bacterium]
MRKLILKNTTVLIVLSFLFSTNINAQAQMVLVEGGTFKMGRDTKKDIVEGAEFKNELPRHDVTLNSFMIGKYEVTVKEYKEFVKATGKKMPSSPDSAWFAEHPDTKLYYPLSKSQWWGWKDYYPMHNVTWYDAVEYCNWLSEKNGLEKCYKIAGENTTCDFSKNGYRLPTEAEWEFAARGGNKSKGYNYSGSNNLDDVAWYDETTGLKGPMKVGTKKPNELGIYDMSGNVWEWCNDYYSGSYYSISPKDNPKGAGQNIHRVIRGGSWHYRSQLARIADRDGPYPHFTNYNYGFRLAKNK